MLYPVEAANADTGDWLTSRIGQTVGLDTERRKGNRESIDLIRGTKLDTGTGDPVALERADVGVPLFCRRFTSRADVAPNVARLSLEMKKDLERIGLSP